MLAFLRATKNEAEIDWILDSAYEHGECFVDASLLVYDGRDFWIEPCDWVASTHTTLRALTSATRGEASA